MPRGNTLDVQCLQENQRNANKCINERISLKQEIECFQYIVEQKMPRLHFRRLWVQQRLNFHNKRKQK